jgi:hypothetical protein
MSSQVIHALNPEVIALLQKQSPLGLDSLALFLKARALEQLKKVKEESEESEDEEEETPPSAARMYSTPTPARLVKPSDDHVILANDPTITAKIIDIVSSTPPSEVAKTIKEFLTKLVTQLPHTPIVAEDDIVGSAVPSDIVASATPFVDEDDIVGSVVPFDDIVGSAVPIDDIVGSATPLGR